jgi:hypothetical protein
MARPLWIEFSGAECMIARPDPFLMSCGRRNKQKHKKRAAQQAAGASRRLAV